MSQVTIGLVNPKSPENVGAVLRAAGCYGADAVFYSGVRFELAQRFVTDTKQMVQQIPLVGVDTLAAALPEGAVPVAVDLIEGAIPLPDYQHPENAFYIFGPEDGTLGSDITQWCRDVIYVPTRGCMNLAASVNVILYDRLAKAFSTPN
ncbi:TrmH family RNA methyltransferase [Aeromonas diversa CDC 2478-85]|uniref:TrmH family RNA methyltransferase n=1 Tax=Aeromonas diversa CDC 2478-85 TaxID=1268237 RepID=N9VPK7_9GAMM|nr:RNA methyltransferase [Aeromonas diversa]ENY73266.1 TrmH family RNA methyltransferase [Aeromonas diversa CDC 2478-85]